MPAVPPSLHFELALVCAAGLVGGLILFARGLQAYRSGVEVATIAPSEVASAAAGELCVSGVVRAGAVTLVSPLQSRPCVYYRARVTEEIGDRRHEVMHEERGVGFLVADETGSIHVFPAGARWELPETFGGSTGMFGDEPAGLEPNLGPASVTTDVDRQAAIQSLLTVHQPEADRSASAAVAGPTSSFMPPKKIYHETALEPGAVVTVIGTAVPFGELPDPGSLDAVGGPLAAMDDPEIAADLAAATAGGALAASPAAAWGNAAIPGFGIGRPVTAPVLDPAANPEPIADAATAERSRSLFDIPLETLVLAARPEAPLAVYAGTPTQAEGRARGRFMLGMAGATLAIASAVVLALLLGAG